MRHALAALALLAAPGAAWAAPNLPDLRGEPVLDAANVIPDDRERALDAKLMDAEHRTGRQLVVATVSSLDGDDIDDYAHLLFRKWKLGRETVNDGVLLLVAPNEHKVRIQTGAGLGPYLTDADSSVVIQQRILPRFQAKDVPGGIEAGVDGILPLITPDAITRKQEQAKIEEVRHQKASAALDTFLSWFGLALLGGGIAFGGYFVATAKKRRERREERERQEREQEVETTRNRSATSFRTTSDDPGGDLAGGAMMGAAAYEASRHGGQAPTWTPTPTPTWTPTPTPTPTPSSDDDDWKRGGFGSGGFGSDDPTPTPTPTPSDDGFTGGGGTDDGGGATGSWS